MGKVQLGFCSLSIVESVWGGGEEEYGPWGEGALKPIRPYREPFSQGPHQQEEGHVHTEIYCSRGYKYSWPYLVTLRKCLLPCFPKCSLYLKKTANFHLQGIISIRTQIIGALVIRDSWLCQYGMNAKGLLPETFALQCKAFVAVLDWDRGSFVFPVVSKTWQWLVFKSIKRPLLYFISQHMSVRYLFYFDTWHPPMAPSGAHTTVA